ncbi:MAG: nucleoside-triphosphatase [Candidatus Hadarchaeum sp.]|uniref:nucleoside-triphosphatase n=1 Tax=Candidatus Hadarchaeum sp. TaxID=2883567 RepID=UPI0031733DCF
MRVILAGEKGVGKTTICRKIIEIAAEMRLICAGTITSQQGDELVVEDIASGDKKLLAAVTGSREIPGGIPHCHFVFSPEGIDFGKRALGKKGDLMIIDEFGKLELMGRGFDNALETFKQHDNVILVVQDTLKDRLLRELDGIDFKVVEVTEENREELPRLLVDLMGKFQVDVDAHR